MFGGGKYVKNHTEDHDKHLDGSLKSMILIRETDEVRPQGEKMLPGFYQYLILPKNMSLLKRNTTDSLVSNSQDHQNAVKKFEKPQDNKNLPTLVNNHDTVASDSEHTALAALQNKPKHHGAEIQVQILQKLTGIKHKFLNNDNTTLKHADLLNNDLSHITETELEENPTTNISMSSLIDCNTTFCGGENLLIVEDDDKDTIDAETTTTTTTKHETTTRNYNYRKDVRSTNDGTKMGDGNVVLNNMTYIEKSKPNMVRTETNVVKELHTRIQKPLGIKAVQNINTTDMNNNVTMLADYVKQKFGKLTLKDFNAKINSLAPAKKKQRRPDLNIVVPKTTKQVPKPKKKKKEVKIKQCQVMPGNQRQTSIRFARGYSYHSVKIDYDNQNNVTNTTKLVTMFTTMFPSKTRKSIHANTLKNWGVLAKMHDFNIVLYVKDSDRFLMKIAKLNGWHVYQAPAILCDVPVLRFMFADVMTKFDSVFYGYANGDILFTENLVETLTLIKQYHKQMAKPPHNFSSVFVTGRRTNVDITNLTEVWETQTVTQLARRGNLMTAYGQDYFIMTKNCINWVKFPDFVIGRIIYDNFLVGKVTFQDSTFTIDGTRTITAMHQTTKLTGNYAGWSHKNNNINDVVIRRLLSPIHAGTTDCIRFSSRVYHRDQPDQRIFVYKRPRVPYACRLNYHAYRIYRSKLIRKEVKKAREKKRKLKEQKQKEQEAKTKKSTVPVQNLTSTSIQN